MFIGREEQLEQLDALWRKNVAISRVGCWPTGILRGLFLLKT